MAQFDRLPDDERDLWLAKWQTERLECPDCHRPLEECSDPERTWYPYRRICYPTMERAAAEAALDALRGDAAKWHDGTFRNWSKVRTVEYPYPAGAGESVNVADRDLAPWDDFTTSIDASPLPPPADEAAANGDRDAPESDSDS